MGRLGVCSTHRLPFLYQSVNSSSEVDEALVALIDTEAKMRHFSISGILALVDHGETSGITSVVGLHL
jgi:hypothetical protein